MSLNYLHHHKDFPELLRILEDETGIQAGLIEKDYWIMHVLHGLKKQGFEFHLKGGTSLSKGYKIIDRFSEDIDIYIKPPSGRNVNENPRSTKINSVQSRKDFYDWLAEEIKIDGIVKAERDHAFDDPKYYRSGGIRLVYESSTGSIAGVKEGILLEVGFDTVTPGNTLTISSWAYDRAVGVTALSFLDNRAKDISCYHPGYTFVEKLQTIATKFRQEQSDGVKRPNLMRQYYDVCSLLNDPLVQEFIGTEEYKVHKQERFPPADLVVPIAENEAFLLGAPELRAEFKKRYKETAALYYKGQPDFNELLNRLKEYVDRL
ncbi:MAG: nucleotidyl transferase AbiEii/AbiGii toxin family protein [Williamsia sp.]|nr:nucleotidyl transferase AbiEii/AbiGii toxin family protein [Williamsia sp.]